MTYERYRHKNAQEQSFAPRSLLRPCALFFGAAIAVAGVERAGAVDWYTGEKTSGPDYAPNVVLDASDSLTSKNSNFGAVALTAALEGNLAQDGFRSRVEGIGGVYQYFTTLPPVTPGGIGATQKVFARQEDVGVLGGYGWTSRDWSAAVYGGVEVINTTLSFNDPGNASKGLRIGAKVAGEFYGNPTTNTMLSGYASFTSSTSEYYSRFKAGYRIAGNIYIGPEFLALGNQFYSEYRAGVHLTGVTIGHLSLGVSGGASSNKITGSGGYGIVDARLGF